MTSPPFEPPWPETQHGPGCSLPDPAAPPWPIAIPGPPQERGFYHPGMEPADIDLRHATYRRFVELGSAPSAADVAATHDLPEAAVRAGWHRLHDAHAIVLDEDGEIRMANPFAARPTDFRVEAGGRSWYANCAWDAFGIGAALHVDSRFETHCPDCGEQIPINVRGGVPDDRSPVFHVLVPAARWWTDIGFT